MATLECTTQAQLDKALKTAKPGDVVVCLGGTWENPLRASGSAQVRASGSAQVLAYDSAQVEAYDSAQVRASGSAQVLAYDSAQVEAYDSAQVRAYGSAQVRASGSAQVRAYDSAQVRASGSAQVRASKYVAVTKQSDNAKVTGGVLIEIPDLDKASAAEWADYYGLEVKRGIAVCFKAVDEDFSTSHARPAGIFYTPGSKPKADDWNTKPECGGGLHVSPRPWMGRQYNENATRYVACPVRLAEAIVLGDKLKVPALAGVTFEVDQDGEPIEATS